MAHKSRFSGVDVDMPQYRGDTPHLAPLSQWQRSLNPAGDPQLCFCRLIDERTSSLELLVNDNGL
jgi:hypothetical protein